MSSMTSTADTTRRSDPLITATRVVGAVFVLVGILGFIPGITTHWGDMTFAGHMSEAKLLGVFQVSILHNIVHLLFGLVGLAAARNAVNARRYLIVGGVIYLVLWLYGLLVSQDSSANFVPVNTADDWLHLVLGLGMVALGFALGRNRTADRGV
jgi:arginine exporter protein ArgO